MKNLLDVMSVQKRSEANKTQKQKPTDYRKVDKPGVVPRFLFECAIKLQIKPLTSASAAIIFHRFFKEVSSTDYDEYLIAASALYLAGKIKDDPVKIRDVINITHNTLNRDTPPLELGDEYWSIRDAIVQAELLIARTLKFDLNIEHPHKYLLYYMKTLQSWLGHTIWSSVPIAKSAASFLQDLHHSSKILNHKPSHVAICCLSLALQSYGIQVPLADESDEASMWYTPFVSELTKEKHWEIIEDIIEIYKQESEINSF
ncbi:PREDICTED: cyclin-related protein FAM58A [Bactrocera latifrons]|uniref:Cyclin-Q n=2 Tax=Bactrocera latifrons TaxID=174628 RepID=A0A0K8TXS4_BACLA|nr:PREDICTED: cyclin-related protein FAM58A [Bactrocera latifrons]XP_018796086.1 PREDICTED: cyclin-related protein FAM58A [Bactrocera latifrons]XP_018796087.1 PREDICTED: cyclin-related protein FAM58A [Bactrocera latifrons]XP_018796088.1 PREDICTED: cyclin-related protein FAM58A [Bactrocera latifrons]